jgi:hypothetical protein
MDLHFPQVEGVVDRRSTGFRRLRESTGGTHQGVPTWNWIPKSVGVGAVSYS